MIYPYECEKCEEDFDITKDYRDAARLEYCLVCGNLLKRLWTRTEIIGAKVEEAEFNHGLGCVTTSKNNRNEIAKRKGLVEVGNTKTETIHKESEYTLNKKLSWENV